MFVSAYRYLQLNRVNSRTIIPHAPLRVNPIGMMDRSETGPASLIVDPLNPGAELAEFFIDSFVSALDLDDVTNS